MYPGESHMAAFWLFTPKLLLLVSFFSAPLLGTRDFVACNHLRAYKYYSDSILNPEGFLGYPCTNQAMFESVSTQSEQDKQK